MTRASFGTYFVSAILALTAAAGCKNKDESSPTATATATTTGSAAGSAQAGSAAAGSAEAPSAVLTDPKIAAIVVAANQVDIDAGALAAKKSKNDEVKKFAERMVTDHTAVNKAAGELVAKLGVTPEESDLSKSLTSGGADARARLDKLDGAEFDKAYVDNEVAYHEAVIDVLANQLIPATTNPELKAALVGAQPAFEAHLTHAKAIQTSLAGGSAGSAHHK